MNDTEIQKKVLERIGRAMGTFSMLRSGDRVGVGVSGGKDSLCLVHALAAYRGRAPFPFEIVAVTVEQGKFTRPVGGLKESFEGLGIDWVLRDEPRTLALVESGVEHGCDVCSRNRRSALYQIASELGCTVLALGHTADDCAEALLRNILFNGRIAALPPVAESRKGTMRVIRPLVYVSEDLTRKYVEQDELAGIGCICAEKDGPRKDIRAFLEQMSEDYVDVPESITAALANVNPYTLFDSKLQKEDADISPAFV
jgi:tRNA 2-thiocytidine biosynthesis protein TtcA